MAPPLQQGFRADVLHDEDGNPIASVLDGGKRRLCVDASVVLGALSSVAINDAAAGATEASVKSDGAAIVAAPNDGGILISGRDDTGPTQRHIRVNSSGELIVSSGAPTPGTTVTSPADTALGIGATVALPVAPVGTRSMVVQVTSGNGATRVRVREVGGTAGAGILLLQFGTRGYGGGGGAIAALEVQHIAGPAVTVAIQFEG